MTLLLPHAPADAGAKSAPPYSLASHQDRLRLLDQRLEEARIRRQERELVDKMEIGQRALRIVEARTQRRNATPKAPWLNFETRKVGGIHFVKLGRLGFSFWVSKSVPRTFQWEGER